MLLNNISNIFQKEIEQTVHSINKSSLFINTDSLREKVTLLIIRDLIRLNWSVNFLKNKIEITPPCSYDKDVIRQSMAIKRDEVIRKNKKWIDKHIYLARANLANGEEVISSKINPCIEICSTQKQHDLFRIFRYYWSSPYSEYVGRRIKLIIRDSALPHKPVMGIAALGSPIIHIPERDEFIGWNKTIRTKNINYMMDAYIIGALPPYNYLLGGKLISYILTTNEIREIFYKKYNNTNFNQLAGIFTTSLFGKSSQYNRITLNKRVLYLPIGETKGYGTLHLTNETFATMNEFLKEQGIVVSNSFGDGPSWSMRVIRNAGVLLGFDSDQLLMHSFKRKIYFIPFANNSLDFLNGHDNILRFYNQNITEVTSYWKERWYNQRKKNQDIVSKVLLFNKDNFII